MHGRQVPLVVDADLRRTAGLWIAGGDYVVFLNRSTELTEARLRSVVAIHDQGTAIVALPAADPTPSAAGWAEYFDDSVAYSFAREILKEAGGFDDDAGAGVERVARDRLVRLGQRVGTCAEVVTRRRTSLVSPRAYVRDRYSQGRALARDDRSAIARLVRDDVRSLTTQPTTHVAEFRRVRWLLIAGALARWAGAVRQSLVVSPSTTGQS
jgi:hypothetical protein